MPSDSDSPPERPKEKSLSIRRILYSKDTLPVLKFVFIVGLAVSISYICLSSPNDVLRSRRQFKSWFEQYSYQFNIIARDNCSDAYSIYLYGTRKNISDQTLSGAGKFTLFVQPMINCLTTNSSNYIQYQLSSSQVMLGLTPTIIAVLGASSEELCLLALIGRRRLLGILLATASPSIYTERAFKYQNPDEIMKDRLDRKHVIPTMKQQPRWIFVMLEYLVVIGAIANIASLNWELGVKSVTAVNPNTTFMPMMWSFLGIASHLAGAVVFGMRVERRDTPTSTEKKISSKTDVENATHGIHRSPNPQSPMSYMYEAADGELCLSHTGTGEKLFYQPIPESLCFIILAWAFSVLIVFHIILGTLILSSTNFVGPKDALGIMARYILSVLVCRIIVVYELAVLRAEYRNGKEFQLMVGQPE